MICSNCGNELREGAKFCGNCGTPVASSAESLADSGEEKDVVIKGDEIADISVMAECVHWNILPGQIAVKMDNQMLASFGKVKGVVIQDGVKAIFFADGKIVGELGAGKYIFNQLAPEQEVKSSFEETGLLGTATNIWRGIQRFLVGSSRTPTVISRSEVTVVLIREGSFPLLYNFDNMPTAGIRSNVALQAVLKVTNIIEFYRNLLVDKAFISFDAFASSIKADIQASLESVLPNYAPEQVSSAQAVQSVLSSLNAIISAAYPFIAIERIIKVTADREELEEIRRQQEELYISERELEELAKRNDFLNRLQDVNNAQLLSEAQTQADFTVAMNKIDEQNLLTEDEKDKFAQTLYAQRQIREAQSDDEVEAALAEIRKAGILRDEEIDALQNQVAHRAEMQALTDGQAIALATLQNEKILDAEKLQWEIEVGNRRLDNELERKRKQDAYDDERRRAEMDLEDEETSRRMEQMRQLQAIRQEREEAEHRREMEARQQQINAQQDMTKLYAGMTAEQIMVANPNITPEAANAMAEKFKADASNDKVQMANQQKDEMRQFMEQQMDLMRTMVAGQQQSQLQAKDAELQRVYNDAEKNQDRMSQVMQTTIKATSGNASAGGGNIRPKFCPNCGAKLEGPSSFCSECGTSI